MKTGGLKAAYTTDTGISLVPAAFMPPAVP